MEEASILIDQGQLSCPICLELLEDPVTIPCGHSFCMACITTCWDHEVDTGDCRCPQCRQMFTPRPVLGRNSILADMVRKLKKSTSEILPTTEECYPSPGDVECGICIGRKRKAEKSCLVCLDSYCQIHFEQHEELHPEKKHMFVDAKEMEEKICSEHGKLMEVFCRTDQKCICMSCVTGNHKGHDIISAEDGKNELKIQLKIKFQQQTEERESELKALTDIVEPLQSSAKEAVDESEKILGELCEQVTQLFLQATQLIKEQEQAECDRAQKLMAQVQEVLIDLRNRTTELEQLPETEDHIHSLQTLLSLAEVKRLPRTSVSKNVSFSSLKFNEQLMKARTIDYCENEMQLFCRRVNNVFLEAKSRKELLWYFMELTLDKFTAFRKHQLSEDNKTVKWSESPISYGDGWSRFRNCRQVLCNEEFSNHAYWEVQWKGGGGISIAVAYSSMNVKGNVSESGFGNNKESWALKCFTSDFAFSHDGHSMSVPGPISETVGVYLDHEAGLLAFYSISNDEATLLYKVHTTFTEPLIPGFYVDHWAELNICSRPRRVRW